MRETPRSLAPAAQQAFELTRLLALGRAESGEQRGEVPYARREAGIGEPRLDLGWKSGFCGHSG